MQHNPGERDHFQHALPTNPSPYAQQAEIEKKKPQPPTPHILNPPPNPPPPRHPRRNRSSIRPHTKQTTHSIPPTLNTIPPHLALDTQFQPLNPPLGVHIDRSAHGGPVARPRAAWAGIRVVAPYTCFPTVSAHGRHYAACALRLRGRGAFVATRRWVR